MTIQNYLMIQENIVINVCVWDGDVNTWTPPPDITMLIQATIPAIVWQYDTVIKDWVLTEIMGVGSIGFTWNGTVVTTNEPKPAIPVQPTTTGTKPA